jgi:hypothetical protein
MNRRYSFLTPEERAAREVRIQNLKAAYANPEKLRQSIDHLSTHMADIIVKEVRNTHREKGTYRVERESKRG